MKKYDRDGKVNFVDENNVFLGYGLNQDCCEHADWFIDDRPRADYPEDLGPREPDLEGFVFDTDFFEKVTGGCFDGGGMAIFRIVRGDENKYIHIFNTHNGYYGHGFSFSIGDKAICGENL